MNMLIFAFRQVPEIHIGKCPSFLVCVRDQKIGQVKGEGRENDGGDKIRPQHPVITYPTAENGNDLRFGGHLRSEINHGNKCEQVTEKVDKIGDEIQVIIKNDGIERGFFGNEFIDIFGKVENNYDHDQQRNSIKKCPQEFLYDIEIDGLQ